MSEGISRIVGQLCFVLSLPIFIFPIFSQEVCTTLMFGEKEDDLREMCCFICGCGNTIDVENKWMNNGDWNA